MYVMNTLQAFYHIYTITHVIINIPVFSYLSQHSITRYKCNSTQYNKILQCLEHVLMNSIIFNITHGYPLLENICSPSIHPSIHLSIHPCTCTYMYLFLQVEPRRGSTVQIYQSIQHEI